MLKKALTFLTILSTCCISRIHGMEYQLTPHNISPIYIEEKESKDCLLVNAILQNNTINIQRQLLDYRTIADVRILRLLTNITFRTHRNYIATLLFARIEQIAHNNRLVSILERINLAEDVLSPINSDFAQDIIAVDLILKNNTAEELHRLYQENFDSNCRIIKIVIFLKEKLQLV